MDGEAEEEVEVEQPRRVVMAKVSGLADDRTTRYLLTITVMSVLTFLTAAIAVILLFMIWATVVVGLVVMS